MYNWLLKIKLFREHVSWTVRYYISDYITRAKLWLLKSKDFQLSLRKYSLWTVRSNCINVTKNCKKEIAYKRGMHFSEMFMI